RSQRSPLPAGPAEDAEGAQRDPAARLALVLTEVDQQLVVMGVLEEPAAIGSALGFHDADRLGDPLVRRDARLPQIVESAEDVVVPPVGEREAKPGTRGGGDYLAG